MYVRTYLPATTAISEWSCDAADLATREITPGETSLTPVQYTQKDDNNYSIIDTRNSYTTHVRLILPSTVTATTGITTIMLIPYDISTVYVLTLSNFPASAPATPYHCFAAPK
jgi:hypothetical protein